MELQSKLLFLPSINQITKRNYKNFSGTLKFSLQSIRDSYLGDSTVAAYVNLQTLGTCMTALFKPDILLLPTAVKDVYCAL